MSRKYKLKLGARYRITSGGVLFPHLVGDKVRVRAEGKLEILTGAAKGRIIPDTGIGLTLARERDLCPGCVAYSHPHRRGGGRCLALHEGPFCFECGQPCSTTEVEVDDGQARTLVSLCCEAEVFADAARTKRYQEDQDAEPRQEEN